jgi:hypothetical protein
MKLKKIKIIILGTVPRVLTLESAAFAECSMNTATASNKLVFLVAIMIDPLPEAD